MVAVALNDLMTYAVSKGPHLPVHMRPQCPFIELLEHTNFMALHQVSLAIRKCVFGAYVNRNDSDQPALSEGKTEQIMKKLLLVKG